MKYFKWYWMWVLLLLPLLGWSMDDRPETADEDAPLERWYKVEILIYKQKTGGELIDEVWPKDIALQYPPLWTRLKTADEYIVDPRPSPELGRWLARVGSGPYTPFVLQNDAAGGFAKAARQIQRFEGDVLFIGSWWQPFIRNDSEEAPAVLIKGGKQYGTHYELEGNIVLKFSRYLHLHTNLWLTDFEAVPAPTTSEAAPAEKVGTGTAWPPLPPAPDQAMPVSAATESVTEGVTASPTLHYQPRQIVLMKQSRRMRSEEIHYVDHPKLGILIRLTPYTDKSKR